MKTNQKIITAITFLVVLCAFLMNACKPAAHHKEPTAATAKDTLPENKTVTEPEKPNESNAADLKGNKPLSLIINNLESKKAPIHVTFYQEKHKFLSLTDILKDYVFIPHGNILNVQVKDLKYGEYAIATYQDLDSDKKCDRNLIGIPTDPYAFSNNFKPTIKAPNFDDCKFTYNAKENTITIKMLWK